MFMLGILSLLAGMVLGQRFKILIVALAILIVVPVVAGVGVVFGETPRLIGLSAATAIVCLQVGYLVGIILRQVLLTSRLGRLRAASPMSTLPARRSS
jgi:hypothetical protein